MSGLTNYINGIKYPYISIIHGICGYFAVMIWWNSELGGFEEPYSTGIGRYKNLEQAIIEAKMWAKDENIDFRYTGRVVKDAQS